MYSLYGKKKSRKARSSSARRGGSMIYLSPRGNPYDKCAAVSGRGGKFEGEEFVISRGKRKGHFTVIGCGTDSTAKRSYGKKKYGTYAVMYEGAKKETYLPTRYISALAYRKSDKGKGKISQMRAGKKQRRFVDQSVLEREYQYALQAGNKRRAAGLLAQLRKRSGQSAPKRAKADRESTIKKLERAYEAALARGSRAAPMIAGRLNKLSARKGLALVSASNDNIRGNPWYSRLLGGSSVGIDRDPRTGRFVAAR
jgi:hypothetical protein